MFSEIKSDEWDVFKYAFNAKFQSTSTRFASKKIKLRYASIKIIESISKAVAHRLHIQESQVYIRVKELINDLNVIYSERNFHVRNYVKLTIDIFKQSFTKTLTNYVNRFNITVAHCHLTEKNKKFWFNKQLNQRLYNRFVNLFEQSILHDLINVMRDIDWKLSLNSLKNFDNRDTSFTTKVNQNISSTVKINQFRRNRESRINKKSIKFNENAKKLIEEWSQWLIDKIKEFDRCLKCLKKDHRYEDKNASCKDQSRLTAKKVEFK